MRKWIKVWTRRLDDARLYANGFESAIGYIRLSLCSEDGRIGMDEAEGMVGKLNVEALLASGALYVEGGDIVVRGFREDQRCESEELGRKVSAMAASVMRWRKTKNNDLGQKSCVTHEFRRKSLFQQEDNANDRKVALQNNGLRRKQCVTHKFRSKSLFDQGGNTNDGKVALQDKELRQKSCVTHEFGAKSLISNENEGKARTCPAVEALNEVACASGGRFDEIERVRPHDAILFNRKFHGKPCEPDWKLMGEWLAAGGEAWLGKLTYDKILAKAIVWDQAAKGWARGGRRPIVQGRGTSGFRPSAQSLDAKENQAALDFLNSAVSGEGGR
jgi:hypothetical protein